MGCILCPLCSIFVAKYLCGSYIRLGILLVWVCISTVKGTRISAARDGHISNNNFNDKYDMSFEHR
eukprot:UN05075